MSKTIALIAVVACWAFTLPAQNYSNAGEYLSHFSNQYHEVAKDQWDYTRAVARGKGARKIENKRQALIQSTKSAEMAIKRAGGYNGDVALRDSVVSYFQLSYLVLKEDYAKIMDMEEVAEQSYDAMEALILARDMASEKLDAANKRVMDAQKVFAEKHGVELRESNDKLYANLDIASEVFDYYNAVYLIFFKSHKQEGYMVEAMNNQDVGAMEQNKTALVSTSQEGLTKLKEHKAYKSDPQLRMACENLLKFHEDEASQKMPTVINFYVQKENYEKVAAIMESKKKKDVTQADVDAYNKATNDYNASVSAFNVANNEMNEKRNRLLDEWNKKTEEFLDRHIPK